MITYILIISVIVAIAYLVIRAIKKAAGIPVLKVKIGTEDGYNYRVEIEKLHPETKDIEYVRLVLNYTAKILFVIEKKHDYVSEELLKFIDEISNTNMSPNDVAESIPEELTIGDGRAIGKIIEGVLNFKDIRTRNIMTRLPLTWFEYQLAHSVMALTKTTVDKLDDFHREYLRDALKYMSQSYNERGVDPREMRSLMLPNEAFTSRHL